MAAVVGSAGIDALKSLAQIMLGFYLACALSSSWCSARCFWLVARITPAQLLKYLGREFLLIFSTSVVGVRPAAAHRQDGARKYSTIWSRGPVFSCRRGVDYQPNVAPHFVLQPSIVAVGNLRRIQFSFPSRSEYRPILHECCVPAVFCGTTVDRAIPARSKSEGDVRDAFVVSDGLDVKSQPVRGIITRSR